jgi:hypothetical protein
MSSENHVPRVLVVGAGIAGLAAARAIRGPAASAKRSAGSPRDGCRGFGMSRRPRTSETR